MRFCFEYRRCFVCRTVLKSTLYRIIGRRDSGSWVTVATLCQPCERAVFGIIQTVREEYQ